MGCVLNNSPGAAQIPGQSLIYWNALLYLNLSVLSFFRKLTVA